MKSNIIINKTEGLKTGITNKCIIDFAGKIADKEIYCNYKINFVFVDNKYISKINKEFFKKKTPTDVIAFNLSDKEREFIEGEIYISVERVKEQAKDYSVPYKEELFRIIVHGLLHIAGFDDNTAKNRQKMIDKQEQYLKLLIN